MMLSNPAAAVEPCSRVQPLPPLRFDQMQSNLLVFKDSAMFERDDDFARLGAQSARFVMISGCSGGGKSTLLAALRSRGVAVQPEPGRQIVREQLFIGGDALPWADVESFVRLVVSRAMNQLAEAAVHEGFTVFDRGLVDAFAWFRTSGRAVPPPLAEAVRRLRYADTVFMAPPWRAIFHEDAERRHGFTEAEAEYHGLVEAYQALGYSLIELPRVDVDTRLRFVMERLPAPQAKSAIDRVS